MTSPPFTPSELESGRKLFAGDWHFVAAAGSLNLLPPMGAPEIAFAGQG
jgi:GTP-binding protein